MAKTGKRKKDGGRPGVAALDRSPTHLLHRSLQLAVDIYAEAFDGLSLTQRQYAVLCAAAAQDGATQTDLVRITGIDRSTLADMAARMITRGLLARERSVTDARANTVRLTDVGAAALAEAQPRMIQADARLLRLISGGSRRDAFLGLLRDLVQAGEAPRDPGAPKTEADAVKPPKPAKDEKSAGKKKPKKLRKAA